MTYIEIDEDGIPLGEWTLGDDGVWIFEEYPPLGDAPLVINIPQTGVNDTLNLWFLGLCFSISTVVWLLRFMRRKKRS